MDLSNNGGNGNGNGSGYRNDQMVPGAGMRNGGSLSPQLSRMVRPDDEHAKARFSVYDYLRLIWRGKWIIGACFLVAALGTAYYTYSLPFVFQSSLNVMLKDKSEKEIFSAPSTAWQSPDRIIKKEISVLRSRPLLKAAADSLLRRRYLDPIAKDTVIPLVQQAEAIVLRPRATPLPDSVIQERLISMLSSSISRVTTATASKEADIITISCKTGDPREAALIANVYAWVYVKNNEAQARYSAQTIKEFVAGRMKVIDDTLTKQSQELKAYQERTGVIGAESQGADLLAQQKELTNQLNETKIELQTSGEILAESKRKLSAVEPNVVSEIASGSSPLVDQLLNMVAVKEADLLQFTANDPYRRSEQDYQNKVRGKKLEIAKLKDRLEKAINDLKNSQIGSLPRNGNMAADNGIDAVNNLRQQIFTEDIKYKGLRARQAAVSSALGEIEGKLSQIPEHMMNLSKLQSGMEGNKEVISDLSKVYGIKVVEEQSQFAKVAIMEEAQPNSAHISPNRFASIMTGSLAGLLLGIGIVLLIAHADTTVHSPDDLEKNGYTVLTAISPIDEAKLATLTAPGLLNRLGKVSPHLVSFADSKSPVAESYRSLRTAIQFAAIENQVRTILVTSSIPQEGKSTTSTNLAIVIAQSGGRTLLIDCDLRRPIVHSIFGLGKEPGLVNALVGGVPIDEAVRETGIPNLWVLSSGTIPPNPSELLGSRRMRDLLEQLKERFDTIILDSPPVSAVTDAVILSTFTDVAITVVRAHKTKMEFLDKTREDIQRVSTNLLGVVLNDFDAAQSYGATYKYYRYYRYYSYYGQADDEKSRKQRRAEAAVKNNE